MDTNVAKTGAQATGETFFSILAEEMGADGAEELVSLEGAAQKLSIEVLNAEIDNRAGKLSEEAYQAIIESKVAEIDAHTRGLPFRLDGPEGPVFVFLPLWRFAGRSGVDLGPNDEPTWDGKWDDYEGDVVAFGTAA